MPQGERPKPPGLRLRPGAETRREPRRPLRAGDQEEAETSEITAAGHRRRTGDRKDGQPPSQRRRATLPKTLRIRPRAAIAAAGLRGATSPLALTDAPADVLPGH